MRITYISIKIGIIAVISKMHISKSSTFENNDVLQTSIPQVSSIATYQDNSVYGYNQMSTTELIIILASVIGGITIFMITCICIFDKRGCCGCEGMGPPRLNKRIDQIKPESAFKNFMYKNKALCIFLALIFVPTILVLLVWGISVAIGHPVFRS